MAIVEPETLTYTITEAARLIGVSRRFAYEMAGSGELPAVRLGHKLIVPKAALERFLAGPAAPISGDPR